MILLDQYNIKKKHIVIAIILFILIVSGIYFYNYIKSQENITFTFKRDNMKIEIYQVSANKDVSLYKTISETTTIKMPLETNFTIHSESTDPNRPLEDIFLKIYTNTEEKNYDINPNLDTKFLETMFQKEKEAIHKVLFAKYPQLKDIFSTENEILLGEGQWYGGKFTEPTGEGGNLGDSYFIVMNKQDGNWKIMGIPQIVLTKYNTPNVPTDILNKINTI